MNNVVLHRILRYSIAAVWLANGLLCKVLGWAPRHAQIVARICGETIAGPLTLLIGFSEIVMAIWVLTQYRPKLNARVQMAVVAAMNLLEAWLAPDLLLWGRWNAAFATLFIAVVYFHTFVLGKQSRSAAAP